jgi:hypothetical protein
VRSASHPTGLRDPACPSPGGREQPAADGPPDALNQVISVTMTMIPIIVIMVTTTTVSVPQG